MKTRRSVFLLAAMLCLATMAKAVGQSGMYRWSVELAGYTSAETGHSPTAYLWIPDGCRKVKAVVLAQQNMTEEAIFRMPAFQKEMKRMDVGLVWVAPWFSQKWDPQTGAQQIFEEMMVGLAGQSGHSELATVPVVPLGHSAQATFPWNFAAWNPDRTLCIVSFHGDAPRTNLCGFGTANVEWGRQRNIDGIPGLMIEGEYEWWDARVRPALAFRMMYPEACISFLCDAGRGHFDCGESTALYIAKFIGKSLEQRLCADGTLKKVDPKKGWLLPAPESDSDAVESAALPVFPDISAAPYSEYRGDVHTAFWYFDREMAGLTQRRYDETKGKKMQYVGFEYGGRLVPYSDKVQGGMRIHFDGGGRDSITITLRAVYTDSTHTARTDRHGRHRPRIEVVSGPVRKIDDTTFRLCVYEAGWDNPRRAFNFTLVAVADADGEYKGAVQPINVTFPKSLVDKIRP